MKERSVTKLSKRSLAKEQNTGHVKKTNHGEVS